MLRWVLEVKGCRILRLWRKGSGLPGLLHGISRIKLARRNGLECMSSKVKF